MQDQPTTCSPEAPIDRPDPANPALPMRHSGKPTDPELEGRFRYHPPKTASRVKKHEAVTERTLALAKELRDICPNGRNLAIALTALEEVRMRANAALACDSPTDD